MKPEAKAMIEFAIRQNHLQTLTIALLLSATLIPMNIYAAQFKPACWYFLPLCLFLIFIVTAPIYNNPKSIMRYIRLNIDPKLFDGDPIMPIVTIYLITKDWELATKTGISEGE